MKSVTCVDSRGVQFLRTGKKYEVIADNGFEFLVRNELQKNQWFSKERFE